MFEGAYTAIVTPFKEDGAIDYDRLGQQIEAQIAGGCGLVPCGTTGENPTLSEREHMDVVAFVVEKAAGRVKVIAGAGSNRTDTAIMLARHAKTVGADAALVITPYYNKPSPRGLLAHFRAVAEAVDIPQVVYNVPGRTGCDILPPTIAELSVLPQIAAVKEATGDIARVTQILQAVEQAGGTIDVLSGEDATVLPLIAAGGVGVISVVANVAPRAMADLVAAGLAGDLKRGLELHRKLFPLCEAMFFDTNPGPVKAALKLLGGGNGNYRLPMLPPTDEVEQRIQAELVAFGLLPQ